MDDLQKGRLLVFAQFGLIIILALFPDSKSVNPQAEIAGTVLLFLGVILLFAGFRGLGKSLTANPVPVDDGALVTTGIYARLRHPIYTGLLVLTMGLVVSSGVWTQLIPWFGLLGLLIYKMRWEETLLSAKHKGYAAYKSRVPALFPKLGSTK
jgi:protein-S-isoprenylcysteine O-methyltransferase Ste14